MIVTEELPEWDDSKSIGTILLVNLYNVLVICCEKLMMGRVFYFTQGGKENGSVWMKHLSLQRTSPNSLHILNN